MTPTEYVSVIHELGDISANHSMNFTTILIAYLVAAYLAGSKLTGFQAWAVTILYSAFAIFPAGSCVGVYRSSIHVANRFLEEYPNEALNYIDTGSTNYLGTWLIGGIFFLAWTTSIAFMINVRTNSSRVI